MTAGTHGFSARTVEAARRVVARYPQPRSALLPLLYLVQAEQGNITKDGIAFCAEMVGLTKAETQSVQTYYEMYEHDDPGDWLITVCRNFSCKVAGAFDVYAQIERELAEEGEGIALKWVECLGNCEGAPVVQVNYLNYERVGVHEAAELVAACRRGEPPQASVGEAPLTFREVSWRLAGAEDDEALQRAAERGTQAELHRPDPPAERIFDVDKPVGSPGVAQPAPPVAGDPDEPPDTGPDEAEEARRESEQVPTSEEQPPAGADAPPGEDA